MTLETRLRLNYLLSQYKTKYEKYYSKEDFEYVVGSFISKFESRESVGTLLLQAYEECGLSEELSVNIYGNFINHLKNDCDINVDLLEVGCGVIPSLAKSLKKIQTSGTITVIDPLVKIPEYGDLRIINGAFTEQTDVSEYKLIYGTFTCGATSAMIYSSFQNDIDLYLALCGCATGRLYLDYYEYLYDLEDTLETLSNKTGRNFDIFEYSDLPYPLIKTYR